MTRFVLVTRHPADCRELQELVQPCGLKVRAFPVLRLEDVDDRAGWQTLETRFPAASENRPDWLLMASPRAPERFVDQADRRAMAHLTEVPAAAVGSATAEATTAAGLRAELIGPGTGLGLAGELLQRLHTPSTVVFACGHHRRPELPHALAEAGHEVLSVEVYLMRPTPPRELPPLPPSLDAVVLTSPRSARLYLEGVGGLPLPCTHWALGPTTRDAAAALGIECRIPERPDIHSLAEVLCTT
jgi:uroporphyrinogen-III synthase